MFYDSYDGLFYDEMVDWLDFRLPGSYTLGIGLKYNAHIKVII